MVTRDELLQALREKDPQADLYESVDSKGGEIRGIVVTTTFEDQPDIVRSQRMDKYMREYFKERAEGIGNLTVYSPSELLQEAVG